MNMLKYIKNFFKPEQNQAPENPAVIQAKPISNNAIRIIVPYWFEGTWVFDDERVNLIKEPFVVGVPEMLDDLVKDIPNAKTGFRLLFSTTAFPQYQRKLVWLREESGGNWYQLENTEMEGWLCPALFKYYQSAPQEIFIKAEAKKRI